MPDDATVAPEVTELLEALDAELDAGDRTVRSLAMRLARLSATSGPAAVQALRALGELVAAQREDRRTADAGRRTRTNPVPRGRRRGS